MASIPPRPVDISGEWYLAACTSGFLAMSHWLSGGRVTIEAANERDYSAKIVYVFRKQARKITLRIPRSGPAAGVASFRLTSRQPFTWLRAPRAGWILAASSDGLLFSARRNPSMLWEPGAMILARPDVPADDLRDIITRERRTLGLTVIDIELLATMRPPTL